MDQHPSFSVVGKNPPLHGQLNLVCNFPNISFISSLSNDMIASFPIHYLRAYGQEGQYFAIETGRRCQFGPAKYVFVVEDLTQNIYKIIDLAVKTSVASKGTTISKQVKRHHAPINFDSTNPQLPQQPNQPTSQPTTIATTESKAKTQTRTRRLNYDNVQVGGSSTVPRQAQLGPTAPKPRFGYADLEVSNSSDNKSMTKPMPSASEPDQDLAVKYTMIDAEKTNAASVESLKHGQDVVPDPSSKHNKASKKSKPVREIRRHSGESPDISASRTMSSSSSRRSSINSQTTEALVRKQKSLTTEDLQKEIDDLLNELNVEEDEEEVEPETNDDSLSGTPLNSAVRRESYENMEVFESLSDGIRKPYVNLDIDMNPIAEETTGFGRSTSEEKRAYVNLEIDQDSHDAHDDDLLRPNSQDRKRLQYMNIDLHDAGTNI